MAVRQSDLTTGGIPGTTGATGLTGATGATGPVTLTGNQTFTGGFKVTPYNMGTLAGGLQLDPFLGNYQYGTNNAVCSLVNPQADCAIDILVTNGASAGALTFQNSGNGWSIASGNTGDPLTTVNGAKFIISVRRINGISTYMVKALQ